MRNLPYFGIGTLSIDASMPMTIEVINKIDFPDELKDIRVHLRQMRDGEVLMPMLVSESRSRTRMRDLVSCTAFLLPNEERANVIEEMEETYVSMRYTRSLRSGERCEIPLAGAVCSSRDFRNPRGEAERMIVFAMQQKYDNLISGYQKAWAELWQGGDIEIEGCLADQLVLYHLYSSVRGDSTKHTSHGTILTSGIQWVCVLGFGVVDVSSYTSPSSRASTGSR